MSERDRANDGREGERVPPATEGEAASGRDRRTRRDGIWTCVTRRRAREVVRTAPRRTALLRRSSVRRRLRVRCLSGSFLRDLARLSRVLLSRFFFFFFFPPFRTFYRSRDEYQRSRSANETNCCTRPRAAHTPDATAPDSDSAKLGNATGTHEVLRRERAHRSPPPPAVVAPPPLLFLLLLLLQYSADLFPPSRVSPPRRLVPFRPSCPDDAPIHRP